MATIQKEHTESTKVMPFPNIFPLAQHSRAQEQLKSILQQHPELDLDPFSKTNDATNQAQLNTSCLSLTSYQHHPKRNNWNILHISLMTLTILLAPALRD